MGNRVSGTRGFHSIMIDLPDWLNEGNIAGVMLLGFALAVFLYVFFVEDDDE